jgi:hypothetical protein
MPYVRDRMAPTSSDRSRNRREMFRYLHTPDAQDWDGRFHSAYGWFQSALVYAKRRPYPAVARKDWAYARRLQLITDAAAVVQAAGCAVDEALPVHRSTWVRRQEIRGAYYKAPETRSPEDRPWRLDAAHGWLLLGMKQARRHVSRGGDPEVSAKVSRIITEATGKLVAWAEEMDADDYGQ